MYLSPILVLLMTQFHRALSVDTQEHKASISSIFESLGYSPLCVARSLTSCEGSAKESFEKSITDSLAEITDALRQLKPELKKARDCAEIQASGDCTSGVRTVYPYGCSAKPVKVYCDQTTDGGAWTAFQNRDALPIREDFYRNWNQYVYGFGNVSGEYWLGLDNLHALVEISPRMEMRVDLEDYEGEKRWAKYKTFYVGDALSNYPLSVGGYTGDAGDALAAHNEQKFSTFDQDNDVADSQNCALLYKGGWWYAKCHASNLNGFQHVGNHSSFADGINWHPFRQYNYSLKKASMKVRPISTR